MDNDWTKVLGFPVYRVYKHEIDEQNKQDDTVDSAQAWEPELAMSGCGRRVREIHDVIEPARLPRSFCRAKKKDPTGHLPPDLRGLPLAGLVAARIASHVPGTGPDTVTQTVLFLRHPLRTPAPGYLESRGYPICISRHKLSILRHRGASFAERTMTNEERFPRSRIR
jgi:hypothetical protein